MTTVDTETVRQFFDKILALKNTDVNKIIKYPNNEIKSGKEDIKEEKIIEKLKSKQEIQYENKFCDVKLACDDKQIRPHEHIFTDVRNLEAKANKNIKCKIIQNDENKHHENVTEINEDESKEEIKIEIMNSEGEKVRENNFYDIGQTENHLDLDKTKFSCNYCNKVHETKNSLKKNTQSYEKEIDHACNQCPKKFSESRNCKCQLQTQNFKLKDIDQNYVHQVF